MSNTQCPNCKEVFEGDDLFCPLCGGKLEEIASDGKLNTIEGKNKSCPCCGNAVDSDDLFCSTCGFKFNSKERTNEYDVNNGIGFTNNMNSTTESYADYYAKQLDSGNSQVPKNSIAKSLSLYFKNYKNFEGRTRRSDFFQAVIAIIAILLICLVGIIVPMFFSEFNKELEVIGSLLTVLFILFALINVIPLAAIFCRRLNDAGFPLLVLLLVFIPPLIIVLLIMCTKDSVKGANKHGESPKYPNNVFIPEI